MPFERPQRTTRRRSSAGPTPPRRPIPTGHDRQAIHRQGGPRPTFLALKDHGKVFVADMPFLSDGQLANISMEASEMLISLERRIAELETLQGDRDTLIKACTKRDVTHRFLRAIEEEQQQRRDNPAIRSAAAESLPAHSWRSPGTVYREPLLIHFCKKPSPLANNRSNPSLPLPSLNSRWSPCLPPAHPYRWW